MQVLFEKHYLKVREKADDSDERGDNDESYAPLKKKIWKSSVVYKMKNDIPGIFWGKKKYFEVLKMMSAFSLSAERPGILFCSLQREQTPSVRSEDPVFLLTTFVTSSKSLKWVCLVSLTCI